MNPYDGVALTGLVLLLLMGAHFVFSVVCSLIGWVYPHMKDSRLHEFCRSETMNKAFVCGALLFFSVVVFVELCAR